MYSRGGDAVGTTVVDKDDGNGVCVVTRVMLVFSAVVVDEIGWLNVDAVTFCVGAGEVEAGGVIT